MTEERRISPPAVGGSSLLVIFGVLAMSVFALLTLSTVLSEKRMAEASARSVSAYYEADGAAEEIFARLRNGEQVPDVERTGHIYRYACPVSERQSLHVELEYTSGVWQVLRWQTVADPSDTGENTMTVWDGRAGGNP